MWGLSFIRLRPRTLKRAAIVVNGLLILFAAAVIFLCGRWGIHSREDLDAYEIMMGERYHPVWKDLAWRRIKRGDPIERVLRWRPPLRRDDFPPYTELSYHEIGSSDRLVIRAKNGRLIAAGAGGHGWTRFFFHSPEEEEAFYTAYSAYAQQRLLEIRAFDIHQAIRGGQDVFLARVIGSHGDGYDAEMMQELRAIYGQEYLVSSGMLAELEVTIEITKVLHGDLQVGAVVTFSGGNWGFLEAGEPEPVFLHVEDMRLLDPRNKAGEGYSIVPRKALDWYQSLTPDQVRDLEARGPAEPGERHYWERHMPLKYKKPAPKQPWRWSQHDL